MYSQVVLVEIYEPSNSSLQPLESPYLPSYNMLFRKQVTKKHFKDIILIPKK